MLKKLIFGSAALLMVACSSSTDTPIDATLSVVPSSTNSVPTVEPSPLDVKLDSMDCSVLITITYDLESAVQSELNGDRDPDALQTMTQLIPVFQELLAKNSQTPQPESGIWLEQMTTDLISITEDIETNGQLSNAELGSQLIANIDRLDYFCPSEE